MNDKLSQKVHWSFWLIAIFSFLWNAGGVVNFAMQMAMATDLHPMLSEGQLALIKDRPAWATIGFGVAMIAALIGSVLLIFKRALSLKLFILSLIGIVIVMVHGAMVMTSGVSFTTSEIILYFVGQSVLGIFLVWYAKFAIGKGWLR